MRKRTIIVTAVPLVVAGAIASAFVSQQINASGSGSTASYKAITATLQVPSDLAPGDAKPVTLAINNPNSFPVTLTGLKFTVTAPGVDKCPANSLTVDPVTGNQVAPAGDSTGIKSTLRFNDTGTNQAGCLGEAVTVTATAS